MFVDIGPVLGKIITYATYSKEYEQQFSVHMLATAMTDMAFHRQSIVN